VSIEANWGLQALEASADPQVDPFESASFAFMAGVDGQPDWMFPISTEDAPEELQRLLGIVVRSEGRLGSIGVTCAIKDSPETTCLACPLSQANNPKSPKCQLCRAGCEQERLSTLLLAQGAAPDGG
jgi:hypothetical protein